MRRLFVFLVLFFASGGLAVAEPNLRLEERVRMLEMQNKLLLREIESIKQNIATNNVTPALDLPDTSLSLELPEPSGQESRHLRNKNTSETILPTPADEADIFSQMEMQDKSESQDSDKAVYKKARRLFKGAKYQMAQAEFQKLIKKYPQSDLLGNSYYWLAESFFRGNKFEDAAFYYLKCYRDFPKSRKAPDCLLQVSLCLSAMGKTQDACMMLDRLDENFPDRPSYSIKLAEDSRIKFGCTAPEDPENTN